MIKRLLMVVLGVVLAGFAQAQTTTVIWRLKNFTGPNLNRKVLVTPKPSENPRADGTNVVAGVTLQVQPTNGVAAATLRPGTYSWTIDGMSGGPFWMSVFLTNAVMEATALTTNLPTVVVSVPTVVSSITAGSTNVHVSPANGVGAVTVSVVGLGSAAFQSETNFLSARGDIKLGGVILSDNGHTSIDPNDRALYYADVTEGRVAWWTTNGFFAKQFYTREGDQYATLLDATNIAAAIAGTGGGVTLGQVTNVARGVVQERFGQQPTNPIVFAYYQYEEPTLYTLQWDAYEGRYSRPDQNVFPKINVQWNAVDDGLWHVEWYGEWNPDSPDVYTNSTLSGPYYRDEGGEQVCAGAVRLAALDGSVIADGTVNSNKLDAATRAMLGGGGGGAGTTNISGGSYSNVTLTAATVSGNGEGLTNAPYLPVLDITLAPFHAVGDGIHDDSAALQNAINTAAYTNGAPSVVFIPGGDYFLSNSIVLPNNSDQAHTFQTYETALHILGEGDESRLFYTNLTGQAFGYFIPGTNKNVQLSGVHFEKFALYGPRRQAVYMTSVGDNSGWPTISTNMNQSAVLANGIACGSTVYPTNNPVQSVGQNWILDKVSIFGFYNALAISNITYISLKDCNLNGNLNSSATFASVWGAHVDHCSLGGASADMVWTNDLADIVLIPDLCGENCANTIIENCEGGFARSLLYRRSSGDEVRETSVRNCSMEFMYGPIIDSCAGTLYVENVASLNDVFGTAPPYLSCPGGDMSQWTIVSPQAFSTAPFLVYNSATPPNRTQLPTIIRGDHPYGLNGYSAATYYYATTIASNLFMLCNGQLYILPRAGDATAANIDALLGREIYRGGDATWTMDRVLDARVSTYVPVHKLESSGTAKTYISDYGMRRFQDSEVIYFRGTFRNVNTAVPTNQFQLDAIVGGFADASVTNARVNVDGLRIVQLYTNQWKEVSFAINTLANPVPNWKTQARWFELYLQSITNGIYISDLSVEYCQPYLLYPHSSGYKLPIRRAD